MRVVDLPATSSTAWITEAFALFRAQPLAWISLTSSWLLASVLLAVVPLVGPPLMTMSQPGFFAGFVIACRDQEMGLPINTSHLLAGFRTNGRALIQIGSVTLLAEMVVVYGLWQFGFFDALQGLDRENPSIDALAKAFSSVSGLWFAAVVAMLAIKGVLWFTAALLAHQPMPASHAIRWSFFALVGNAVPLLLFGVMMFSLLFVAVIPWGLGLLVFVPIYAISHYTSFKSVFRPDAA
jgi:uncharacterized membrane protein